jgi:hypothetical protein
MKITAGTAQSNNTGTTLSSCLPSTRKTQRHCQLFPALELVYLNFLSETGQTGRRPSRQFSTLNTYCAESRSRLILTGRIGQVFRRAFSCNAISASIARSISRAEFNGGSHLSVTAFASGR